jgi:hypothetical protein
VYDNLFPLVSTDDCHASDVIRELLEESHFVPGGFPFGTLHFGEIGQYADWVLLSFRDKKTNLRLEGLYFFGQYFPHDLEAKCRSAAFLEPLNHKSTSSFRHIY